VTEFTAVRVTEFTALAHVFPTADSARTKVESTISKTAILPTNDVLVPIFSDSRFTTLISVSEWNW